MRKKKKKDKRRNKEGKASGCDGGKGFPQRCHTHCNFSTHVFFFCIEGEAGYWEAWEGPRVGEGGLVMGFVGYVVWLLNFWGLVVTD